MKKSILLSGFVCMMTALFLSACGSKAEPDPEKTDPKDSSLTMEDQSEGSGKAVFGNFTSKDLNGNEVDQDIFAEKKLTMVNIWATFCGPCLKEMPELGELNSEYQDQGLQIVGMVVDVINQDGTISDKQVGVAQEAVDKTGADYLHILPSQDLLGGKLGQVTAVPETIFVDENGIQVGGIYTGAKDKAKWESIIKKLLEEVN